MRQVLASSEFEGMAELQSKDMTSAKVPPSPVRWFMVPLRVLRVTFLLALLSFAVCLFVGILGLVISAAVRGVHPNMTIAYRQIAFPAAILAGAAALVGAMDMETGQHRHEKSESHR